MKNIVSCYVEENGKAVSVGIAPPSLQNAAEKAHCVSCGSMSSSGIFKPYVVCVWN